MISDKFRTASWSSIFATIWAEPLPIAQLIAQIADVISVADETDRHEIDLQLGGKIDVEHVLFREWGEIYANAWQVDMSARAHVAIGNDFAGDPTFVDSLDAKMDLTVVDEHDVADRNVFVKAVVVGRDGDLGIGFEVSISKFDDVSLLQFQFSIDVACPDRWPLEIDQDCERLVCGFRLLPNLGDDFARPVVLRVAHVETKDVRAGLDQFTNDFGCFGGRSQCGDDFRFSMVHEAVV